MSINKKSMLFVIVACVFVIAVVTCVVLTVYTIKSYNTDNETSEIVTIELMSPWVGMNQRAIALDALIDQFNAQNDRVRVVNKSVAPDLFYEKLNTDFSSGNYHDIIMMPPNYATERYIDMGYIIPIQDALDSDEDWKALFDKSTFKLATYDNKIYSMPYEVVYQAMYYNTDLFDRYNLEYPQTFDELIEVSEVFKQKGIIPIATNFNHEGSYFFENIFAQYFPNVKSGDINNSESAEKFNKVIEKIKLMYDNDVFPEDAFELDDYSVRELFLDKKAAMIVEETAFISEINDRINQNAPSKLEVGNNDMKIKIATFPFVEDSQTDSTAIIYGLGEGTFFVTDNCVKDGYEESVYDFLHFVSQPKQAKFFSEKTFTISALKSLDSNAYYSDQMQQGFTLIDSSRLPVQPPSIFFGKDNWYTKMVKELPYVLEGKKQSYELWDELNELELD